MFGMLSWAVGSGCIHGSPYLQGRAAWRSSYSPEKAALLNLASSRPHLLLCVTVFTHCRARSRRWSPWPSRRASAARQSQCWARRSNWRGTWWVLVVCCCCGGWLAGWVLRQSASAKGVGWRCNTCWARGWSLHVHPACNRAQPAVTGLGGGARGPACAAWVRCMCDHQAGCSVRARLRKSRGG